MCLNRFLIAVLGTTLVGGTAFCAESKDFLTDGKFWADLRYRYETVDQDGLANDAKASTLRTRVGFETAPLAFSVFLEAENILSLGSENYNDTINGKTTYPVVADPEDTQLNQGYVKFTGLEKNVFKLGRQVTNLDNQRFVGDVAWRQNQQTFDSFTLTNTSFENTECFYSYLWQANRVFGTDSPMGEFKSDSHLLHATNKEFDACNLTGYAYLLDFKKDAPVLSSETFGLRATGKFPMDGFAWIYAAEYASQKEYADNPASFDLSYYLLEPGFTWGGLTTKLGFESMEGDGKVGFSTPLATLHAFNGWVDKFLNTPAKGLEDTYLNLTYLFKDVEPVLEGLKLMAVYHDYSAQSTNDSYGTEWNFLANYPFLKHYFAEFKYGSYQADGLFTDTKKLWGSLGAKF